MIRPWRIAQRIALQSRPFSSTTCSRFENLPKSNSPIVSKLDFFNSVTGNGSQIPTYRVIDGSGKLLESAELPEMDEAFAKRLYENMMLLPTLDNVLYNVQRQGKISFYMTAHGEEATIIGSAAGLDKEDEVLDFHAGLLLASTIPSPTLYIARNNGFAISTPSKEQYHGDGIAARGPGYGIDTIRVDGNDVLAVLNAVREARRRCLEQGRAVLLEAMSYRVGHHSTSDDSFAYRPRSEVEDRKRIDNPIVRFRLFLEAQGWWNAEAEADLKARLRADVMKSFKRAENLQRHELGELFSDVYAGEQPWNLVEQKEELGRLLRKYGNAWEPWKKELSKFKNNGEDVMGRV
ncbi:hypothetical protein H1R20_g14854, partial [Candolleomyces eurysporus]